MALPAAGLNGRSRSISLTDAPWHAGDPGGLSAELLPYIPQTAMQVKWPGRSRPQMPTSRAVANAIAHAIGMRIR